MSEKNITLSKSELIDLGCALIRAKREYKKLADKGLGDHWLQEAEACKNLLKKIDFS